MSALQTLLNTFRNVAKTEREKGTYFEELVIRYLTTEPSYKDLYSTVWTYADWAALQGLDRRDTGIDLVAKTYGTEEYHAIQCKFYDEGHRVQKSDINSFFTASGKKPFTHRLIICTTSNWSEHAEDALQNQQPPVSKIDLSDLENSQIDWTQYQPKQPTILKEKKKLREHQQHALAAVERGLKVADRGKLIMACGTGKTFTSLKIAETLAGKGKRVLFLVPSLSLLSQTLTEWTQESATPLHSFAVCSDADVGKKRKKDDDDVVQTFTHELRYPATTSAPRLALEMEKRHDAMHMSVVFSTYHSIDVVSRAQKEYGLADFDLIICDEAHRTTGAIFEDKEDTGESNFVRVHDATFIRAAKRLYMTATPRIYGDAAKVTAEKGSITLCSMDDEALYGRELFVITFSEAVKQGLLVDYKVIVLAVDQSHINSRLQKLLADENNQLKVDDAARIVGCWKALSKQGTEEELTDDEAPMQRAVAFCQVIEANHKGRVHKVSSKNIASMFSAVVEAYKEQEAESDERAVHLSCEAEHVDGSMNATQKEEKLGWLKATPPENTCRILSNVRCLSEGVDVPALDAVLFLTPRNSQVDVVQSVGRVMRTAPGKKRGYVILPVVIPANVEAHKALDDNKVYRVVWQVLQALRAHDDRFDAMINKLDLAGQDTSKMEVIAVSDKIIPRLVGKERKELKNRKAGRGGQSIGTPAAAPQGDIQGELTFEIGEIERAIYAKVVQKCGNRGHWEEWANDIAKIAQTHIDRIRAILENPDNGQEKAAFAAFAAELRDDLNNEISDNEAIEMLAQHLITKPVFDALFEGYSFASENPISQAMQGVLDILHQHNIDKEADTLQRFYDSVKLRASGITDATGRQKIIVELYDKFFRNAFPRMTEKLGIVYTPIEVVDFIIHSVNDILKDEFGQTLGSENVHIIDPFTGTGTFITRLLHSGLIGKDQLPHKFRHEIHANDIVLLAYYIAAINIESAYHDIMGGDYVPFDGICLTDTFQLYEKDDLVSKILVDNSARRTRQKNLDIRVIIGNPPYSIGQGNANDGNANTEYEILDASIRKTYATSSSATLSKGLYDSYVRAIRWASDRIKDAGVIGFVSGNGFIEKPAMDGLRKCLAEEFTNIYVLNLRGDIRKNMLSKGKAKEGQNIFGSGSMTGIAVTLFVKNPQAKTHGTIRYYDIGDDLKQTEKLEKLTVLESISAISASDAWAAITPDQHNDWINQRDDRFTQYISMGDKKDKNAAVLFENYSLGIATNRDAWCYNTSRKTVTDNMQRMIEFYNTEVQRFNAAYPALDKKEREKKVDRFVNADPTKISWTRALKQELAKNRTFIFASKSLAPSLYRPFTRQWLYYSRVFNEMVLQVPRIFPDSSAKNRVICVSGIGARSGFSTLIVDAVPNLHTLDTGQCFPLYLYDTPETEEERDRKKEAPGLFDTAKGKGGDNGGPQRRDAITDAGLGHFQAAYPGEEINKEDVFYYVYGLLHSEEYRAHYADNLAKELPRIPCVKKAADFWAFSRAGRKLAELHIGYETVAPYPVDYAEGKLAVAMLKDEDFHVEKMRFAKKGMEVDKTGVVYNHKITMTGIPLEAYDYVVNGKSALEWVMERQGVRTDKDSGIVNDANDWAIETMKNPRYPLELFQRVITVSLETIKIVCALPTLEI